MQTLGLLANPGRLGLATDLYQLTMAAAYWENCLGQETATFELFTRRFPGNRGYLICAGLEQALEYLQALSFSGESIAHLNHLVARGEASREVGADGALRYQMRAR